MLMFSKTQHTTTTKTERKREDKIERVLDY